MNPLKMLQERFGGWLAKQVPADRQTRYDFRHAPRFTAAEVDVDRVHEILEQAEGGNLDGLMALYRDMIVAGSHLQSSLGERKEAVLGDTVSVQPVDKENADDVAAAAAIADLIEQCREWELAMGHLLDSVVYPVAIVEKTFRPTTRVVPVAKRKPISLRYELAELTAVPHDLLTFTAGRLQIRATDEQGRPLSAEVYEPDPARYLVHRGHLLATMPDSLGGPMRSIVFWWLLGTQGREWWARFLERYGAPFTVAKYDAGDDGARASLASALGAATRLFGLVVSRETEIELKQAAASDSGDAFDKWRTVCNEEISKLINGVVASDAKGTALGSQVPKNQQATKHDRRASDARRLGQCLRYGLAEQYLAINGLVGRVPKILWASDAPDQSQATGELLVSLEKAGLEPDDTALPGISERVGFQVRRKAAPAVDPLSPQTFSARLGPTRRSDLAAEANAAVVRTAAAQLAPVLRRRHAPLVQLIAASGSPEEAIARVEAFCAELDPTESAEIIERALASLAANGSLVTPR